MGLCLGIGFGSLLVCVYRYIGEYVKRDQRLLGVVAEKGELKILLKM